MAVLGINSRAACFSHFSLTPQMDIANSHLLS